MSDTSDPVDGTPQIVGATGEELPTNMTDVSHVIAYDEDAGQPGGLNARYVVTVVTGETARDLDARQAEAIRKLLEWASTRQSEKGQKNAHGSARKSEQ